MANDLTRTSNTELARAQEIVNRHGTAPAQDAGGHAAAVASSPEMRRLDVEIEKITSLAHTGRMAASDEYERRQGELHDLIAEKNALMRGSAPTRPKTAVAAARGGSPVPTRVDHYPALPDIGQPPELYEQDAAVWGLALPKLLAAGITIAQAQALARISQEAANDADALQEERRQHVHEQSQRELARRYGSSLRTDLERANAHVRTLLPDGASRQLCSLRLADGSTLGDHQLFCRLLVELSREAS